MRIIPAIDILGGKCVRLSQGDYNQQTTYFDQPLEVAISYEQHGFTYLHLVDLDGAKAKTIVNSEVLETITTNTALTVDFGGGIKSKEDIKKALALGAKQVTLGSLAATDPELVLECGKEFGTEAIIIGADCKDQMIATHGWTQITDQSVFDFVEFYTRHGFQYFVCTDIAKDGMLAGPSTQLYGKLLDRFDIKLVASGGVSSIDDLNELKQLGCDAAIVGKAIYENRITLKELAALC